MMKKITLVISIFGLFFFSQVCANADDFKNNHSDCTPIATHAVDGIKGASSEIEPKTILFEDFEDNLLDSRITISTTGNFNSAPGIKNLTNFGSTKAFGYGKSTCGSSCFDRYVTNFKIDLLEPTYVSNLYFKEMELYGNWGSKGKIFIDGNPLTWGDYNANQDFGRQPTNDGQPDINYRSRIFILNRQVTTIELKVADITNRSEIFIDDVGLFVGKDTITPTATFNQWQDINLYGNLQRIFKINVPANTENLFFLVRKSNKIGHHGTWNGQIRIFRDGTLIAEESGMHDFDAQFKNDPGGTYYAEIWANFDATGQIKVCDHLDSLTLGEWHEGTVLKGWGHDWTQIDMPTGIDTMFFETQGFGIYSNLNIYYESLDNKTDHWYFDNWQHGYNLKGKIAKPKAGRYIFKYEDSDNVEGGDSQERDYLLKVDITKITDHHSLLNQIYSLSTYEVGQGLVTIEAYGTNFDSLANIALVREGCDTIYSNSFYSNSSLNTLWIDFDLTDSKTGEYKLVLIHNNGTYTPAPNSIKLNEPTNSGLLIDILGRDQIRTGRTSNYLITILNNNNISYYDQLLIVDIIMDEDNTSKSNLNVYQDAILSERIFYISVIYPNVPIEFLVPFTPQIQSCFTIQATVDNIEDFNCEVWTNLVGDLIDKIDEYTQLLDYTKVKIKDNKCDCKEYYITYLPGETCYDLCDDKNEYENILDRAKKGLYKLCKKWPNDPKCPKPAICDKYTSKQWYDEIIDSNGCCQTKSAIETNESRTGYNSISVCSVSSSTPEDKYGTNGFEPSKNSTTSLKRYVSNVNKFTYRIDFWNKETATAPAQEVFIWDTLDTKLDESTLNFTEFGFLRWTAPLKGGQYFNVNVDMRPDMNLIVNVEGKYDPNSREIKYTFRSLDPLTMELTEDPLAGFLSPIDTSGYQIGWVEYKIKPVNDLATGTTITNQAWVNFDGVGPTNPAPKDGPWTNTIDNAPPESYVNDLPFLVNADSVLVSWIGNDEGSGIRNYNIFVSENAIDYSIWLNNTNQETQYFEGGNGKTYYFYSIAKDNVGLMENPKSNYEAMVKFEVATGIEEIHHENREDKILIYPNPAEGSFTVISDLDCSSGKIIEVFNSLGEKILENHFDKIEITINLPSHIKGIYFVKVTCGNIQAHKKVVTY